MLEKSLCTDQESYNIHFSKGSYSLIQFLKIACCFPSPISSCLCPFNFKQKKKLDHFNINSTALLMILPQMADSSCYAGNSLIR